MVYLFHIHVQCVIQAIRINDNFNYSEFHHEKGNDELAAKLIQEFEENSKVFMAYFTTIIMLLLSFLLLLCFVIGLK